MIETAFVCLTGIIITILIINYKNKGRLSAESIQRIEARLNELSHQVIAFDVDKIQQEYKEIKESTDKVNQQIQQVNAKLAFSSVRNGQI